MTRLAPADLERLKDGLTRALDQWVPARFPGVARDGALYRMYDASGGRGESFVINRLGKRAGSFHDFWGGEAHGGVLDLWMLATRESDFRRACAEAARYLGDPSTLAALEAAPSRDRVDADDARRADWMARLVKALFLDARPLIGSPAEDYLIGRGLPPQALAQPPGALRFHPGLRCPRWRETGELRPGMVAIVTGAQGGQSALHQTFLGCVEGRWTKAPDLGKREQKRSLGPVGGGFIPLQRGASGKRWPDMPAGDLVHVTEGIEDGLSVCLALSGARVIAAISMGNMAHLPIPPSGAGFALCAQNDAPATLEKFEQVRRALARRCPVVVVRPPAGLKDWNDWVQALARPAAPREREVCAS